MGPAESLERFRECLVSGRSEMMDDYFSFASAYQYWSDIAASLGRSIPERGAFREMLQALFASSLVVDEVSSYQLAGFREKVVGPVASVVFQRIGGAVRTGVASLVKENDRWKVRTYPGVFPGELLSQIRRGREVNA